MDLIYSTWSEVEAYLGRSRGIVVPLGSVEQHGPHGNIGTDSMCAETVARGVADRAGALLGPTIQLGVAPFNLAFPGTISVRSTTFMAVITDYVRSLAFQGFESFYFLNGHGGNLGPLRAACQDLQAERSFAPGQGRLRFHFRSWWEYPGVDALRRELYGDGEGMHATPSEIALTQAAFPQHARPCEVAPPVRLSPTYLRDHGGDNHADAARHRQHFPDGRVGSDSGLARPEHGHRLLALAVAEGAQDYTRFAFAED